MIPPPTTTMAVIGERAAASAPTVSDSDSDHECPEKEPEFVIDIVDSLSQPLLFPPRHHQPMQHPPAAVLFQPQPRQFAPSILPQLEYANMPKEKECTNCFICKIVHCVLVLVCVGVTLMLGARLPEKYKQGDGGWIMMCPIVIAVLAVYWLMLDQYNKEQQC